MQFFEKEIVIVCKAKIALIVENPDFAEFTFSLVLARMTGFQNWIEEYFILLTFSWTTKISIF